MKLPHDLPAPLVAATFSRSCRVVLLLLTVSRVVRGGMSSSWTGSLAGCTETMGRLFIGARTSPVKIPPNTKGRAEVTPCVFVASTTFAPCGRRRTVNR